MGKITDLFMAQQDDAEASEQEQGAVLLEWAQPRRRGAGRVVEQMQDLPSFKAVLSVPNGALPLGESQRDFLAVLLLHDERTVVVLCTPDQLGSNERLSLSARARSQYADVQTLAVRSSVLLAIYALCIGAEEREKRERAEGEEATSTKVFREMVERGVREKAADIHVCIREEFETAAIMYRVDGKLRVLDRLPAFRAIEAVGVAYTKLAEQSSRSESTFNKRVMQSCAIPVIVDNREYKLRWQSTPVVGGMDVVLRILETKAQTTQASLVELGYSPSQCALLDQAARKTVGAIVIAGVTGSGKSTTLKTLMTLSPTRSQRKSYSIEDPVEYRIPGVSQVSVQRSADDREEVRGNPFAAAMRMVLRADPDIIMVGEIRDAESCSLLKTMVQSGHQVMTTVHAASAIDIIERMSSEELGLSREVLGGRNFLSALVYQRLLPLLCPICKLPAKHHLPREMVCQLEGKFGLAVDTMHVTNPQGCPHCKGLGTKGVTVVAEVLMPNREFLRLVREGRDIEAEDYWRGQRRSGFDFPDMAGKTALEHGLYKVHMGLIDPTTLEDAFEPFELHEIAGVTA